MPFEEIALELIKSIGPAGAASACTVYIFLRYYKGGSNNNDNTNRDFKQCILHSHLEDGQKVLFSKLDSLHDTVAKLPLEIINALKKEK